MIFNKNFTVKYPKKEKFTKNEKKKTIMSVSIKQNLFKNLKVKN